MSGFLKINFKDLANGVTIVVLGVIFGSLQQALETKGLNVMEYDWAGIITLSVEAAMLYLSKKFLTTEDGKLLGRIKL